MSKLNKFRNNNLGFSLVEFIIVITIMALLVGIVGTQVIPYIDKAKQSKDIQKVSSYCTNAVTAYVTCASSLDEMETYTITVEKQASSGNWKVEAKDSSGSDNSILREEFLSLNGLEPDGPKCQSKEGKKITKITIECKDARSSAYLTVTGPEHPEDFIAEAE